MKANRGLLIISVACLGGTLIPDMSGFCSVDVVHGNLSQKQEKAALLVLPRVPGRGFGGGGGFEFLCHKLGMSPNQPTCWQREKVIPSVRTLDP